MATRSAHRGPDGRLGDPTAGPNETSILFVCTANQCRSPFAEAIARRRIGDRPIVVASAGLIDGGQPVPENGLEVAAELGFDLSGHRSRRADVRDLRGWDVILTMSREHLRELVAADPELWPRVFTVRQFRRWLEEHPPARRAKLAAWIDVAATDRSRFEMVGASADDDVADPLHAPQEQWRELAALLDDEISAIIRRLTGARRSRSL